MQVYDCFGSTTARRRSLLAADLFLEWTITVPEARAKRAQTATVSVVQQAPAALQRSGLAVTGASASVIGTGPSVAQVEVFDYATGEAFMDEERPVILLTGEAAVTLTLPVTGFEEPGWTAVDNVDGDISARCRVKFLNRTEDFRDVTPPGRPLVMRCELYHFSVLMCHRETPRARRV